MTPLAPRATLRRRRAELRRAIADRRGRARAGLLRDPVLRRRRQGRRLRRAIAIALLATLACLLRCECPARPRVSTPAAERGAPVGPVPQVRLAPAPPPARPPFRRATRVEPLARGELPLEASPTPAWLDGFRLAVAARGPRLAACFTGAERPGALRWTTSLSADQGAVSDHELEPLGPAVALPHGQAECLVRALSDPPYRLEAAQAQALPRRVSLLIEF